MMNTHARASIINLFMIIVDTYLSSKKPGFHDVMPSTFVDFTSKLPDMVPVNVQKLVFDNYRGSQI